MGELALFRGESDLARAYLEQSLEEGGGIDSGNPERRALSLANLSLADLRQGRFEEAKAHAVYSLRLFNEASVVVSIPGALDLLGVVACSFGDWDRAARLLGAGAGLAEAQGLPLSSLLNQEREAAKAAAIRALGADGFKAAFAFGSSLTIGEAVAFALDWTH
jgi:tetratricopeptide (TPR) repeat protein